MKKKIRILFATLLILGCFALAGLYVGQASVPVLEPKGLIAYHEKNLIITASLLMLIVVIPVFIMTAWFVWKYHARNTKAKYNPDWGHSTLAETIWWGVPFLIIIALAVITYQSSHALDPYRPIVSDKKPLSIQVVALDWKWLFIYPDQGIATINYIEFPEQTPLSFSITADAPMNSFWIPQLGGQIYAMPAMKSQLHLMASQKGSFRGASANISGRGFAGMTFTAKATSEEEFNQWVQAAKDSPKQLTLEEYRYLQKPSEYVPPTTYALEKKDLFEWIMMQYTPQKE